jgi:hypothetical protein
MTIGPTQKSLQVANFDANPVVATTSGEGAPFRKVEVDGYVTPAAADAAGTKYLLNRVRSTAHVKSVVLASEAQGAGAVNVGVYYADDVRYLAPGNSANAGVAITADFFASAVSIAAKVQPTDVTFESGTYTFDKWAQPLWQALGLASDPGGFFDIVATVNTTDITTGTGKLYLRTGYSEA